MRAMGLLLLTGLAACGGGTPTGSTSSELVALQSVIAASTGYSSESIEILSSVAHLRISISDSKLAQADQVTRESTALAVVAAFEQTKASNPRFASVQEVSVAVVHPSEDASHGSHVEDVIDFRKGPNQRFALHTT